MYSENTLMTRSMASFTLVSYSFFMSEPSLKSNGWEMHLSILIRFMDNARILQRLNSGMETGCSFPSRMI